MSTQFPGIVPGSVSDPARLFDELKRIAVEQLAAVPGGLYRPLEEQLQEALRVGEPSAAKRKDLMTVLALRQRGSGYVMRYRELIARSFDDFRGRAFTPRPDLPLGLADDERIAGFIHIGTPKLEVPERDRPDPQALLPDWTPPQA